MAEPVTLKSSIDPALLTELVELREFDGVASVASLTDSAIRSWLDEQLKPDEDDLLSLKDIASAVRRGVRINTQETKPKFRIKRLFIDYRRFMRERGWNDIVETAMEESTGHICGLLQPPALRTRVQTALSRKKGGIHNDWNKFFEFCLEEAVTVDRYVPINGARPYSDPSQLTEARVAPGSAENSTSGQPGRRRRGRRFRDRRSVPEVTNAGAHGQEGSADEANSTNATDRQDNKPQSGATGTQSTQTSAVSSKSKSPPRCLNSAKCKGYHLLRNCPHTAPIERKKLLDEYHASRAANRSLKTVTQADLQNEAADPPAPGDVLPGLLADQVRVRVNLDSGAAHSALSVSQLAACDQAGMFVPLQNLKEPIRMKLAVKQTKETPDLTCAVLRKARLSLTLETPMGPLRLRNINFLVMEDPMDEILLSRPMLREIGYDPNLYVGLVREQFQDAEFSHVGFDAESPTASRRTPPTEPSALARIFLDRSGQPPANATRAESAQPPASSPTRKISSSSYFAVLPSSPSSDPARASHSLRSLCQPAVTTSETSPAAQHSVYDKPPEHHPPADPTAPSTASSTAARLPPTPSPLFYGDGCDDDPLRDDDEPLPGADDSSETQKHLRDRVREAKENGMEPKHVTELAALLTEFADVFRTKLGADPPAKLPPMEIALKPDAKPARVKLRRYSPQQVPSCAARATNSFV